MIAGDIPDLVGYMDVKSIRVHAPAPAIFVCSGPVDAKVAVPPSLRDAFMRIHCTPPFSRYLTILAEELNAFFPEGEYKDILKFETDIAQICDLIILFSESYGSVAELGAFSMIEEIALRLLVVMDDFNYGESSFVTLGPVRSLLNAYGESAICVLHRDDLGIISIEATQSINLKTFSSRMGSAILARMAAFREPSTFDPSRNGHIIKFIVGMIQHYGALTLDEIEVLLFCMDINKTQTEVRNFLLCSIFLKWIVKDKRGINVYYSSIADKEAVAYKAMPGLYVMDKNRWRADILDYWKNNEPERFDSIRAARAKVIP